MLQASKIIGFCDFCVPYTEKHNVLTETLRELIEAGYRNVAIEQHFKFETLSTKFGKEALPAPVDLKEFRDQFIGKLNIFNRLTIEYSDPSVSHACSRSPNFKKFHIIAALPTNEAALQHSCQTFQGDIISYNFNSIRTKLTRKFYYMAIRRNMFFEIKYTPTILDSSERRATITRSQQYHMSGKSRGIIITSGATDKFHVRSPFDVACLGYIFGLTEEQGRAGISSMCKKLLVAAESRRLGRTPVALRIAETNSSDEEEEEMEVDDVDKMNKKRKGFVAKEMLNKKVKIS